MLRRALLRRRELPRAFRSNATSHRHGARWMQSEAVVASGAGTGEIDSGSQEDTKEPRDVATLPTPIATAMALAQQLEHLESSNIGRTLASRPEWLPNGADWGLAADQIMRAKSSLMVLRKRIEKEYPPPSTGLSDESHEELQVLKQKGMTQRLGRVLIALADREQYRQIEAVAFLWEDAFPEFATNAKHLSVICEHYIKSLLRQKRYSEILEIFFTSCRYGAGDDPDASAGIHEKIIFTPQVMGLALRACGHLKDPSAATELLRVATERDIRLRQADCSLFLDGLLRDDPVSEYEDAMRLCDVLVRDFKIRIPTSIVAILLRTSMTPRDVKRALEFYSREWWDLSDSSTAYHLDVSILAMWDAGAGEDCVGLLKDVLELSSGESAKKASLVKGLLRKVVRERDRDRGQEAATVMLSILELMAQYNIRANTGIISGVLDTLICHRGLDSVDALVAFVREYPTVMEWNASVLCEAILVAVRREQLDLINGLVVHALDTRIPIKYPALESVVAFYYRMGSFESFETAARMVHAMRDNRHLPLGMALTEIGMTCNLRLGRYEEVALLFEDFASRDSEKQRVATRRPMLFAALEAYRKLHRFDEAQAVRQLLEKHHRPSLSLRKPRRHLLESGNDEEGRGDDTRLDARSLLQ